MLSGDRNASYDLQARVGLIVHVFCCLGAGNATFVFCTCLKLIVLLLWLLQFRLEVMEALNPVDCLYKLFKLWVYVRSSYKPELSQKVCHDVIDLYKPSKDASLNEDSNVL